MLIDMLVNFEEMHDEDTTFVVVGSATFKDDFGPWKQGEKVESLTLDYHRGYVEECDEDGEVVRGCAVKLVVDERERVRKKDDEDE